MSNPFPDHTIEAVGACTRALAGLEYADAAIAQAGAATLSGLRAFGDRLALRARYHDSVIHVRHRPDTPLEAELFDQECEPPVAVERRAHERAVRGELETFAARDADHAATPVNPREQLVVERAP